MTDKGYWFVQLDVTNPDGYKQYVAANAVPFRKFGGRFLIRGGQSETKAGKTRSRMVLIEFKDYATALACYHSPEYAALVGLRDSHAVADIAIVEGYSGPQPTD